MEAFLRSSVVESFARPGVELASDSVTVGLGDVRHAFSFGKVLANQPVGVLVGSAFPRVVGRCEIEASAGGVLDARIAMELCAIVCRNGSKRAGMPLDELDGPEVQRSDSPVRQFPDERETGFPFHEGDDAILLTLAHHRVDFPVAELSACFDSSRPLADHAFVGEFPAKIGASVALATLLSRATQVEVEPAPALLIGPHVSVDRFVTDSELAGALEVTTNLLGAPLQDQEGIHERVLCGRVLPPEARASSPAIGAFLGFAVAVVSVVAAAVTGKFTRNGAAVSPERSGNRRGTVPFLSEQRNRIPLFRGELVVRHG